jgi:hypothetical protein
LAIFPEVLHFSKAAHRLTTIKIAMSNDGYTPYDIESFSHFVPSLYTDVRLLATNVFTPVALDYKLTVSNLNVNDDVKMLVNKSTYVISKITDVDLDTNTFTVSNYYLQVEDFSEFGNGAKSAGQEIEGGTTTS